MKNKALKSLPAALKLLLSAVTLLLCSNGLFAQHHAGGHHWQDSIPVHIWNDTAFHAHHGHDSIPPATGNGGGWNDSGTFTIDTTHHHHGGHIWGGGQLGGGNDSINNTHDTIGQLPPDTSFHGGNGGFPGDSLPHGWNDSLGHTPHDTTSQGWNDTINHFPPDSLPQGWNDSLNNFPHDSLPQGWNDSLNGGGHACDTTGGHGPHRDLMVSGSGSAAAPVVTSIYPNPMAQSATISVSNTVNAVTFRMFESTGKVVSYKTGLTNGTYQLNREALTPGLYFYEILEGNKVAQTGKLIVQ